MGAVHSPEPLTSFVTENGSSSTALLVYIVLLSNWEFIAEVWFWKAIISIAVIHSGILVAIVTLNLDFPGIDTLPRLVYGVLVIILSLEVVVFRWLLNVYRPEHRQPAHR